jgi:RND family efflux transporter MFP subunit
LQKVNFKEGDLVKAGAVLFEIDPRPYEALLNQAKAKVRQDEAQLEFDEAEYRRIEPLAAIKAMSKSELDKAVAARDVDLANIAADKAQVASRQLDLDYTKVTAPVGGRVSRFAVTVGNLVQAGDQNGGTLLTTIVSVDPMYAYFDVDEQTIQRARRLVGEGKITSSTEADWPVSLGLATEAEFPHQGTVDFVDNQVNPKTGTLRLRGVFRNLDGALTPGYFARVRTPVSPPRRAVLVADRAIFNDQGQKVLYVVNDKNEVVSRPVRPGQLHDGLRVIEDGLKPGERVIVSGQMQVRPGVAVDPKVVPMQTPVAGRRSPGPGAPGRPEGVAKTVP